MRDPDYIRALKSARLKFSQRGLSDAVRRIDDTLWKEIGFWRRLGLKMIFHPLSRGRRYSDMRNGKPGIRSWFYRSWPALAVGIGGCFLIAALCGFIGGRMHNQDAAIALSLGLGWAMGIPVGHFAIWVWERRNP